MGKKIEADLGDDRECFRCKLLLHPSQFSPRKYRRHDGTELVTTSGICKPCAAAKNRAYRDRRSPEAAEQQRAKSRESAKRCRLAAPEVMRERVRNYYLLRDYGISAADFDRMSESQGGLCLICGMGQRSKWKKRLCVDHCHDTGAVRGLLCDACNRGLGLLGEDPERLERAARYVRENRDAKAVA